MLCYVPLTFQTTNSLESYTIHILDGDIDKLIFDCQPKDDKFGNKTFSPGAHYAWTFRRDFFDTTKYIGHFYWMGTDDQVISEIDFHVFDNLVAEECGTNVFRVNNCYWLVKMNGFYFARDVPTNWKLKYVWAKNDL